MRVRHHKPYVRIDCDYANHFRFQETKDIEVSAGVWLRCLAHSHAQEQNGIVKLPWLRRTFAGKMFRRVEELVRVGLLRKRDDGDYEIYGYAPRNGTLCPKRSLTAEVAVTRDTLEHSSCDRRARAPSESSDLDDLGDAIATPVTPREERS
jgi:hypothetical protein